MAAVIRMFKAGNFRLFNLALWKVRRLHVLRLWTENNYFMPILEFG